MEWDELHKDNHFRWVRHGHDHDWDAGGVKLAPAAPFDGGSVCDEGHRS